MLIITVATDKDENYDGFVSFIGTSNYMPWRGCKVKTCIRISVVPVCTPCCELPGLNH